MRPLRVPELRPCSTGLCEDLRHLLFYSQIGVFLLIILQPISAPSRSRWGCKLNGEMYKYISVTWWWPVPHHVELTGKMLLSPELSPAKSHLSQTVSQVTLDHFRDKPTATWETNTRLVFPHLWTCFCFVWGSNLGPFSLHSHSSVVTVHTSAAVQ